MSQTERDDNLEAEANAFTRRISERVEAGFIADLRRAVKCEYFYKSFWRDPQFIDLYLGDISRAYLGFLDRHCGRGLRILDVGCGAGYMSLELAREGHHVTAIDISEGCIATAKAVLADNPFTEAFGSLEYRNCALDEADGTYDVVLFSVSLHHFPDVEAAVTKADAMLKPGGHFLCYEPCHERFLERDAAFVVLLRGLLSITGHWYDPDELIGPPGDDAAMARNIRDVRTEYVLERDKNEPDGQSPNDLEASGEEILAAVRRRFREVETRPGFSIIYRILGGLRGDEKIVSALAEFIAAFDRTAVREGYLNENHFYFIGRKPTVEERG